MITDAKYYEMFRAVQSGKITDQEWSDFCFEYLKQIVGMPENRAVMVRLKNR